MYLYSLPPTGISNGTCVRRRVNVKSQSTVFITVLRVLTGNYLSYQSECPGFESRDRPLNVVCSTYAAPPESANDQTYRPNEHDPNRMAGGHLLTLTLTLTLIGWLEVTC